MIEANELRIGNWVNTSNGFRRVTGINEFTVNTRIEKTNFSQIHRRYSDINHIQITEEIILRCGFKSREKYNDSKYWFIGVNPITHDWLFDICWISGYEYPFYQNGHHQLKYLHQLQNLYWCLCGKELEINLNN